MHVYEVRPRKDKRGVDLISDVLPFGRLWYYGPEAVANAIERLHFFDTHFLGAAMASFIWRFACSGSGPIPLPGSNQTPISSLPGRA